MSDHHLKIWPAEQDAITDGRKRFEVRSTADRVFSVGDVLHLHRWDPCSRAYLRHPDACLTDAGRGTQDERKSLTVTCRVTYILPGGKFGLPQGLCVMGIADAASPPAHPQAPVGQGRST